MNIALKESPSVTMTSLELVEYINNQRDVGEPELRHDNFMAKVPQVLGEAGVLNFQDTYIHQQNGQTYPCYRFPKREACLMAMSYSYELQAKVFDRMTALESKPLDILRDPAAMRALLLGYTEEVIESRKQLAIAAPKVEFVDRYVDATGLKGFRQVAKLLEIKEPIFRAFLVDNKIQYFLGGEYHAFQHHIDAGRFSEKTGVNEASGHAFNTCKFTPKGVAWIAGLIASKSVSAALVESV